MPTNLNYEFILDQLNELKTAPYKKMIKKTKIITDEVHLMRKDEVRKFDYNIRQLINTNIYLKVDPSQNKFWIYDKNTPTDECGFIRVCVSYEAYV